MDFSLIQSASVAAVKTILEQQDFDVLWEHSWEAGNLPANSNVRISYVSDDIVGRPYIRFESSGTFPNCVLIEKEWQDRSLVLQYNVHTLNQTLSASAPSIASQIRSGFNLTPIQEILAEAGMSPSFVGPFVDNSEVGDRHRVKSQGTFEVTFNVTSIGRITEHNIGPIAAVEISGSVTGSQVYNVDMWITSAFYPSPSASLVTALFDEALIPFNWEDQKSQNFTFAFPDAPHAIVMTVQDDVSSSGGVFLQGVNYTTESLTIAASAPFSGSVRYRAIWSPLHPNYPATVTSSLHPASGVLSASARQQLPQYAMGAFGTNWNVNYWSLVDDPTHFWINHWSYGEEVGIPVITTDGFGPSTASGSVAAPIFATDGGFAGKLHYIAFISGAA